VQKREDGMILTSSHENSDSAVDQNTLFHGESLFIISSSNSESVTLEFFSENLSVNIGAHSSIVEVATKKQ